MALFTVLEVLEVLIDALTFKDEYLDGNYFDAGVIAGKGLVNGGFTLYYIIMEYTAPEGYKKFDWEGANNGLY